ncbi:dihydroorotase [Clostridia bacterium]|nr:dihydroorotase [Clostridia bacterium]
MILIKNGRIIDPVTNTDKISNIVIDGETIKQIGMTGLPTEEFGIVIDAGGLVVSPGLVDVHVHFRDPGLTYKEDIESGSAAAARGGFTTVVCMANTKPVMDSPEGLGLFMEKAGLSKINVKTIAAVSKGLEGKELTDPDALIKAGAVGFSDDGAGIMDSGLLLKAMTRFKALDVPISLHEEDPSLIENMGVNAGPASDKLGLKGATSAAESTMVARDSMLALHTGAKVHFQHLSCKESVAIVRLAKSLGARITAEVTPSHFSLTENAVIEKGSLAKVNPPLRSEKDRRALIEGLKDGTIDMIATDHAPHSDEEKARVFTEAPSGIIGLETALALGITNLVRPGELSLATLIERISSAPARLYGISAGFITEGGPGDLVIFDPDESWTVTDFLSKSSNSPFLGQVLYGRVKYTICGGAVVYKSD